MKKAVIVVGKQNSGKSGAIRHFKKLVKMEGRNKFTLRGKRGFILSTSFDEVGEKKRPIEATIKRLSFYDFLVFACQGPTLARIHAALKKASFSVKGVSVNRIQGLNQVQIEAKSKGKAKEIFNYFISN